MTGRFCHSHSDPFFWANDIGEFVGFVDETYETRTAQVTPFYCLAAVVVHRDDLDEACDAVLESNGGQPPHAAELYGAGGVGRSDLFSMIATVANWSQCGFVTIRKPLGRDDLVPSKSKAGLDLAPGDLARAACLHRLVRAIYVKWDCDRLVLESRHTPYEDRQDQDVVAQVRASSRDFSRLAIRHTNRFKEPLLAAADLLAWSFRQDLLGRRTPVDWFSPLRDQTKALSAPKPTHPLFAPPRGLRKPS